MWDLEEHDPSDSRWFQELSPTSGFQPVICQEWANGTEPSSVGPLSLLFAGVL